MTNERPENVWATTLPNGLRVRVLCKPGFQRSYAVLAACYGGADRRFRVGNAWTDTPAGVAHYLEHKLFDMPDGSDALLTLSENGADPNAFTSTNMTAYYFSCTDRFEDNLRTLLRFVSTPYFTDASVAKEQGIIAQEIRMGEDDPDRAVWRDLMRCLLARDGARDAVAGIERLGRDLRDALDRTGHGVARAVARHQAAHQVAPYGAVGVVVSHADLLRDDALLLFHRLRREIRSGHEMQQHSQVLLKMLGALKIICRHSA